MSLYFENVKKTDRERERESRYDTSSLEPPHYQIISTSLDTDHSPWRATYDYEAFIIFFVFEEMRGEE